MKRIDHSTAAGERFVEQDPTLGRAPTQATADWWTTIQRETVGVVEGEGLTLDKGDNTQLDQAIRKLLAGGRVQNLLLNPDGAICQRHGWPLLSAVTVPSDAETYVFDRWFHNPRNGTLHVSNVAADDGWAFTTTQPEYVISLDLATAPTNGDAVLLAQRIEDVHLSAGRKLTVSLEGLWSGVVIDLGVRATQHFGPGGSADVAVGLEPLGGLTTTTAGRAFVTFDVPSVDGKTIPAPEASYLEVSVEAVNPFLNTSELLVAHAQAHVGGALLPFLPRPRVLEEELCLRYFETSRPIEDGVALPFPGDVASYHKEGILDSLDLRGLSTRFRVPKRVDPTVTWASPITAATGKVSHGTDATVDGHFPVAWSTGYPHVTALTADLEEWARGAWAADAEL